MDFKFNHPNTLPPGFKIALYVLAMLGGLVFLASLPFFN